MGWDLGMIDLGTVIDPGWGWVGDRLAVCGIAVPAGAVRDPWVGWPGDPLREPERAIAERGDRDVVLQRAIAGSHVALVGAGIINLITAVELLDGGARVTLIDAGPDPRDRPPWHTLGATHGGGNVRMYSPTETGSYHGYAAALDRPIRDGGWLAIAPQDLDPRERAWIQAFQRVTGDRPAQITEEVYRFNRLSGPRWQLLRHRHPHLFAAVGYCPGVLRLYDQHEDWQEAIALYERLGVLEQAYDPVQLITAYSGLAAAAEHLAGGVEIDGFTLNIHPFGMQLLDHIQAQGGRCHWQVPATAIARDPQGRVTGLETPTGLLTADHYVLSPGSPHGATAALLADTAAAGQLQGVAGVWLQVPQLDPPLGRSLKLHHGGAIANDANVILTPDAAGQPGLAIGSGYAFVGGRSPQFQSPDLDVLWQAVATTAARFFPAAYAQAVQAGMLFGNSNGDSNGDSNGNPDGDRRVCVRPFTATGLGLLTVEPTATGGRLAIAAGHNTGGFTQAPEVAIAIAHTLAGHYHPMQLLCACS
jgi:glycine/D-amino acid oxidase-like deaminating enzyme